MSEVLSTVINALKYNLRSLQGVASHIINYVLLSSKSSNTGYFFLSNCLLILDIVAKMRYYFRANIKDVATSSICSG